MNAVPMWRPGDPLPEGHVCKCRECAPEFMHLADDGDLPLEQMVHGHFLLGSFPPLESVHIDGQRVLTVLECQAEGTEPWAIMVNTPIHRCQACGSSHACLSMVWPRRIDVEVRRQYQADYERIKGRILAEAG